MLIDFHTHKIPQDEKVNYVFIEDLNNPKLDHQYFCLGIHPWQIENLPLQLEKLNHSLQDHPPFALGEIGIDKINGPALKDQILALELQLELAIKHKIKRIVFHSVRGFEEIYQALVNSNYKDVIIFHDFNASIQVCEQFDRKFKAIYSFGEKIFKENTKAYKTLKELEISKIMLESDESSKEISEIYTQAAKIRNIDRGELIKELNSNFFSL